MVGWSTFLRAGAVSSPFRTLISSQKQLTNRINGGKLTLIQVRNSGHGPQKFYITPSRWQWHKFKDMVHFYLFLGFIPMFSLLFYANVFIGPAQLAPIPDGYEPKHWEYYPHPFQRWIAQYFQRNPQQDYEKMCHELFEETEKTMLRKLEWRVKDLIQERLDYQAWYYRPVTGKYHRKQRAVFEELPYEIGE